MTKPCLQPHSARSPLGTCSLPFSACPPRRAYPAPALRRKGTRADDDSHRAASPNQAPPIANVSDQASLGTREREKFFFSWKFNYRGVAIKCLFNMLRLSALPVITVQPALKEDSWASLHWASALSPLSIRSLH